MAFITLVLLVFLREIHGEIQSCGAFDPLYFCDFDVNLDMIPFNEHQLEDFCRKIEDYYSCVKRNEDASEELCGYSLVIKKSEPLITNLCDKTSELNKNYIEYAPCFKNLLQYLDEAHAAAERMIALYIKVAENQGKVQSLKTCLAGTQFWQKLGNIVSDICGEEAYSVFGELVATSHFYLTYCATEEEYYSSLEGVMQILNGILIGTIKHKEL